MRTFSNDAWFLILSVVPALIAPTTFIPDSTWFMVS
jgi:hypothetical protein